MAPEAWLADLARCLARLAPGDQRTRTAVAGALGLELAAEPEPAPPPPIAVEPGPAPVAEPPAPRPAAEPEEPEAQREPAAPPRAPDLLQPHRTGVLDGEQPWEESSDLPRAPAGGEPPSHRPLFAPRRERELLLAAAGRMRTDGEIDADAAVETLARGRPVAALPRLPRRGVAHEVQALVDIGAGMEPFARDRCAVVESLRLAVGGARVTALQFRDSPLRGAGAGPVWTWEAYEPPGAGARVLAFTDLGIARGVDSASEWVVLAARLAERSARLVALVPYPAGRLPQAVKGGFPIVTWDRATGVADVTRALHLARR